MGCLPLWGKKYHFLLQLDPLFRRLERRHENQPELLLVTVALNLIPNLLGHLHLVLPSAAFLGSPQALDCPQTHSEDALPSGSSLPGETACCVIQETPIGRCHMSTPPSRCATCLLLEYCTLVIMGWALISRFSEPEVLKLWSHRISNLPSPFISKLSPQLPTPPQFWESLSLQEQLMEEEIFP